jgi:dienelactone hydrolase
VRWWSIADRHNGVAERQGTLVLEPFGRGNVDYRWIGERDVLRCLAEAKRRFAVDEDRVYLGGESMGGNGTWLVASRHPELFAAAAPVFGGWDYRVWPYDRYNNPRAARPAELFAREVQSSFAGAEGLLNVPLLVVHGDVDASVPVENSRHAVRMLQRWNYDVRYHEIPGRAHEELNERDAIAAWLLEHRRVREPREVRLRAIDLAGAAAHWVEVTAWLEPLALMEARATIVKPGWIRLETRNVGAVRLSPPRALVGTAPDVRVVWNGEERTAALSPDGSLSLAAAGVDLQPGGKSRALEGHLTYFFGTPFAIVVGTAARDPEMARLIRDKAEALAVLWERWQHVRPRVLRDDEVTPEHERRYSLLLVGGADANRVSARIAGRVPLAVGPDAVTIDGRRFAASDAVAQVLYPSPFQPERYVLVVAATSTAGMRAWEPAGFWVQENGYPTLPWDFTVQDGRRVALEPGLGPERGWIAAGIFDRHWRRDDRWVSTGDEALRARASARE